MAKVERTEREALRDLAAFTYGEVNDVIVASLVTMAAEYLFHKDPEHRVFARHPGNVLPHRALRALEEQSIVHIAEALKQPLFAVQAPIRRKQELINHRDSISHPHTVEWRRPAMREFDEKERHWLESSRGSRVGYATFPKRAPPQTRPRPVP